MNLIARRTKTTGASDHTERGIKAGEEKKNSSLRCSGLGYVDFLKKQQVEMLVGKGVGGRTDALDTLYPHPSDSK